MGYFFAGLIFALPCAAGFTFHILSNMLNKSNNIGDSKGTVNDFSFGGVHFLETSNRVNRRKTDLVDVPYRERK